jgi:hypothetical protein
LGAVARKVIRQFSRLLVVRTPFATVRIAAWANHAEAAHFGAVSSRIPADLYKGHCLPALPAAAMAARARSVKYGFDAEDFHNAETESILHDRAARRSVEVLQEHLLKGCSHLTAAAPLIGAKYAELYGVRPDTILNVFPRDEGPQAPIDPGPICDGRPARIYWFSQTIGPGRGLERVASILGRMRTPVELNLRGFSSDEYASQLQAHATRSGLIRPIRFLAPGLPREMAILAAGADLGLSTEDREPLNRDLCLTNKIFVYLLAGIPQLLSDTSAQRMLAPELGIAAILADLRRTDEVAKELDEFFGSAERIANSRRKAWDLAVGKYCWDLEKTKFLESIRSTVPFG